MGNDAKRTELAARSVATIIALGGCLALLDVHVLRAGASLPDEVRWQMSVLAGADLLAASVAWSLPWRRWPHWSSMLVMVTAVALHTGFALTGGLPVGIDVIYLAVGCAWLGLFHPPRTTALWGTAVGLTFVTRLWWPGLAGDDVATLAVALPLCVLSALAISLGVRRLSVAQQHAEEQVHRLRSVVEAGRGDGHPGMQESIERALQAARSLGFASAAVELCGPTTAQLFVLSDPGRSREIAPCGLTELVDHQRGPVVVSGAELRRAGVPPELADHPHAAVARLGTETRRGALLGTTAQRPTTASGMVEAFGLVAQQLGRALTTAHAFEVEQHERLRQTEAAHRDELTGLGNRRAVDAELADLRAGDMVLALDLDHFKRVNDAHGHAAGDAVLRQLGAHLQASLRPGDHAGRYGGEEFVVVVRRVADPTSTAARFVDGWRRSRPVTTISAGYALHAADRTPAQTLEAADRALYAAKAAGRDRAVAAAVLLPVTGGSSHGVSGDAMRGLAPQA